MADDRLQEERQKEGAAKSLHEIDWLHPADDELVDFVTLQYEAGKDRRLPWEAEASVNLAFVAGDQSVEWSQTSRDLADRLVEQTHPEHIRQKIQINTIKDYVIQRMSMLFGVPITWEALPFSNEDEDMATARVGTKLLRHLWGGADRTFDSRLLTAAYMLFSTGTVFAKPIWDPLLGATRRFKPTSKDGKGQADASGVLGAFKSRLGKMFNRRPDDVLLDDEGRFQGYEGDVKYDFPTGFEITEPEYCTRVEEARWMIHTTWKCIDELLDLYGPIANTLNPTNDSEAILSGRRRLYGDYDQYGEERNTGRAPAELVLVHELWRPGLPRLPKGHRSVIADKTVLWKGDNPYRHGMIPIVKFGELPDDRFRGASTVSMLRDLQSARNSHRTQMATYINRILDPHILHEAGCQLPEDAFEAGPSKVEVPNDKINAIKALQMPTMPSEAIALDAAYREDMQDVGGVHNASLGKADFRGQSGKHAEIVKASDERGSGITRKLIEESMGQMGAMGLALYDQYARGDRLVRISGGYLKYDTFIFKSGDLSRKTGRNDNPSGPHSFNVMVQISAKPDLAGVIDKMSFLVESGILDPENPAHRVRMSQMLGENIVDDDDESRHRSVAMRENHDILALAGSSGDLVDTEQDDGKSNEGRHSIPAIARGDDDQIHLISHERLSTDPEYREAMRRDPNLEVILELHIREHMVQMSEKLLRPEFIKKVMEARLKEEYADRLPPEPEPAPSPGVDPATGQPIQQGGLLIDPSTGLPIDPLTGLPAGGAQTVAPTGAL